MAKKRGHKDSTRSTSVILPSPLLSLRRVSEIGERFSELSFKQWHMKMQTEHEMLMQEGKVGKLWKPFQWFDSIEYEKKICRCCFKFKTFKFISTIFVLGVFTYLFIYSLFKEEVLPGSTAFFIFSLVFSAYVFGFLSMFAGLPPLFGNLLVGVVAGNVPPSWLPNYDATMLEYITVIAEKACLVIAIIRAGLLLDLSRIKGKIMFIILFSLVPVAAEFVTLTLAGHYFLKLPWVWSCLLGCIICILSLACVTTVMEKSKSKGYGEDKHLSTVLVAASSINVIIGIMGYITCIYLTSGSFGIPAVYVIANLALQIVLGFVVGVFVGLLAAFFPDRRNPSAGIFRIVMIGLGAFALAAILNESYMPASALFTVIVMCIVASNMWEELGWHDTNNPVQYFYTIIYYICQPIVLSLVGFTMNFHSTDFKDVAMYVGVIFLGLVFREVFCFLMLLSHLYPTSKKEKIFILVAWLSKGTFQALLSHGAGSIIVESNVVMGKDVENFHEYSQVVKQTTILGILLITPVTSYALTSLAPVLLSKTSRTNTVTIPEIEEPLDYDNKDGILNEEGKTESQTAAKKDER